MMRRQPTFAEKIAFLKRPAAFGSRRSVRTVETHFAWVFLCGERAYKLKKSLRHRQMDYRSIAARERGCREEVRLNQRMAAGVYRRVVPLTCSERGLAIGGAGHIVDWLIEMTRLPDAGLLDHALRAGRAGADDIDRVARSLSRFYTRAAPRPQSAEGYLGKLARAIRVNEREIERYSDALTQRLAHDVRVAQLSALRRLRSALGARGACVVDGHGDLRAEHVYLGRPIQFIDSLEFDPKLRLMDPAEEVALLAIEIERLGFPALADRLILRFRARATPSLPDEVFAFYKSHRAATRAKLAAWHIGDPQFPDPEPWVARTASLLEDALRHARHANGSDELGSAPRSTAHRRPAMQQRRERGARDHPADGFGEQGGHMQFR